MKLETYDNITFAILEDANTRSTKQRAYTQDEILSAAKALLEYDESISHYEINNSYEAMLSPKGGIKTLDDYIFYTSTGRKIINFACVFVDLDDIREWDTPTTQSFLKAIYPKAYTINPLGWNQFAQRLVAKKEATLQTLKEHK